MKESPKSRGRGRPAKANRENASVRTVHVATKILDALAEFRTPVRITDLAKKLNMTMPTVSRHVATWRELGFIEKAEPQETLRLGSKLFSLGQAAAEQNTHVNVAYRHLIELRDLIHETILLCTRVQEHATALLCLDSGLPTTIMVRPGATFKMPYSPTARVLWAFATGSGHGTRASGQTFDFSEQPELNQRKFNQIIMDIQHRYYDIELEVRGTGIGAISTPVFEHNDNVVAAITVIFPSRSGGSQVEKRIVEPLQRCAAAVSAALGSGAWDRYYGHRTSRS